MVLACLNLIKDLHSRILINFGLTMEATRQRISDFQPSARVKPIAAMNVALLRVTL